jgi:N-acetylneuraminate synthase
VFIIAEAGVNHNGDLKRALELVDAAAEAKADAVKFQTFSADRLVTHLSPKATYQRETTDANESQYEMLKKLELSADAHRELKLRTEKHNMVFLSTPFDSESADLLDSLGVQAFKLGSGELTDLPLVEHVARKDRPMILSTGMSNMVEVQEAVRMVREAGLNEVALLHCVSAYPAPVEDCNLLAMDTLRREFNVPVGYSDHTEGIHVAVLAVAAGADIIEKHLTLDRALPGPDHRMSLEPKEFKDMVQEIRHTKKILGNGNKQVMQSEANTKAVARKSVAALVDIKKGRPLTREMLGIRRPGLGIQPSELESLIGRKLDRDVPAGSSLYPEWLV